MIHSPVFLKPVFRARRQFPTPLGRLVIAAFTSGLTGRAMRTVTVSPAEQSLELQESDNAFHAPTPANDNASSTPLVSDM